MYKKILFCTDGSANSMCAQREAIKIARECGSKLYVLSVVDLTDEFEDLAPGLTEKMIAKAKEVVAGVAAAAKASGVDAEGMVRDGEANRMILDSAKEVGAEAIMLGTHGRKGFMNAVMGSVTRKVIAEAPVPVIVVHSKFCAL
ncbi:MAG: universal stress protein [Nitrospirae bacterium]|nr:universal stress protein [Nitrospirota bacterium]